MPHTSHRDRSLSVQGIEAAPGHYRKALAAVAVLAQVEDPLLESLVTDLKEHIAISRDVLLRTAVLLMRLYHRSFMAYLLDEDEYIKSGRLCKTSSPL